MILLRQEGSHGACVRGKQRSILLPNCLESWTLKHHVQFICNSHTTTMRADPIGSGNMLSPSKTPKNNWQLMRAQPKLEKPLHAPTRNRQLTIPPMSAKRSKPMVVCTCNNPNRRGCSGTMQGIVCSVWDAHMGSVIPLTTTAIPFYYNWFRILKLVA